MKQIFPYKRNPICSAQKLWWAEQMYLYRRDVCTTVPYNHPVATWKAGFLPVPIVIDDIHKKQGSCSLLDQLAAFYQTISLVPNFLSRRELYVLYRAWAQSPLSL